MQGKCAKCGGENLDYHSMELRDNDVYYPYTCADCGHDGKEWYHLEYIESE